MSERDATKNLSKALNVSNMDFMGTGIYQMQEIYERVKKEYPALCNDNYLCIENCRAGNKSPEWHHVIRGNMQTMKRRGRAISVVTGTWSFVEMPG